MQSVSVTLQTRAQVERVQRDIDEARSRAVAAKAQTSRRRLETAGEWSSPAWALEEQPCLD